MSNRRTKHTSRVAHLKTNSDRNKQRTNMHDTKHDRVTQFVCPSLESVPENLFHCMRVIAMGLGHSPVGSFRSPVPKSVLQVAQAVAQATSDRCYSCFLPGSYFEHPMLMAREGCSPSPSGRWSLAPRLHHAWFLGELSKTAPSSLQSACALQWSSPRLPPCENDTVLNDPPLVYDLLLRWHFQGNCLCSQTVRRSVLRNGARRTCRKFTYKMEAKELHRVVATQAL